MKLSTNIKPISYLKANAASIVGELKSPLIITQNGEAKAVIQDIKSFEQMQETLALLKLLALGQQQIESGQVQPAKKVLKHIRQKRDAR